MTKKIPYRSWPFKEAEKLCKRFQQSPEGPVRFETGFGPSGLPHIGTFAENARTTWVRHAFEFLTGWPTQLIAFSDDMDGLRKVPLNMPRQDMLASHLGKPLCHIPDPFETSDSYSGYMNAKLRSFLDGYQFDYTFQSSYEAYHRGDFNEGLEIILRNVDAVKSIILPTMSPEKGKDWSPFFPICGKCGKINSTRVTGYDVANNAVDYVCDRQEDRAKGCGHKGTASIFDGNLKVGWKVDWALRWYAYDIAYEMYGKDLIESARLSGRITRLMGKQPPTGLFCELFLDEDGRKISKSVGRGLTIDSWTMYAPLESLLYYIFQNPKQAKRLFWGIVPKSVDDYLLGLNNYHSLDAQKKPDSTLWHIFDKGTGVPEFKTAINFSLVNNLVSAVGADDSELIWEYLKRYDPSIDAHREVIEDLVNKAMNYYRDFIVPRKQYRMPSADEKNLLKALHDKLAASRSEGEAEIQTLPFDLAREKNIPPAEFFKMFYEVVFGQERGPRFGTFVRLVGKEKVLSLLEEASEKQGLA